MAILDEVSEQIKEAMRAKDKARTMALRNIRAAFIEALKADGAESLPDEAAIAVLTRLAKQRKESIAAYEQAGREDLAGPERDELAVIEAWLPTLADEAQTRAWAEAVLRDLGVSAPGDMGRVMGELMKRHRAQLDGKIANAVVRSLLQG